MSDFLSREADILGGEFGSSHSGGVPRHSLGGDIPEIGSQPGPGNGSSGFSFDDFDEPQGNENVKVTGDDELEKFESQFPELEAPQSQAPSQVPSYTATFAPRPQPSAFSSTPILTQQIPEEEPEVIREWKEKQRAEIEAREAKAKNRRQDIISQAERSIDEFYEEYAKKKERNIGENKDHEAEFLQKQTDSLASGTTWERICDLIELQNSQSKTLARTGGTTDLTRFKEVLLRLKREGDAAPGAGGY
ncbi:clathrin light chain [Ephemerocybe angulata]|uniref:Clathrin light chain n=1 Tax=Ephemerocybe angulata TaxID=980116 RepID=A0A8H6ICG0_9AGAR|nr:clathrin light chain [Tulosesus angulatus]